MNPLYGIQFSLSTAEYEYSISHYMNRTEFISFTWLLYLIDSHLLQVQIAFYSVVSMYLFL